MKFTIASAVICAISQAANTCDYNEEYNEFGPGSCWDDIECRGDRYCRSWYFECGGESNCGYDPAPHAVGSADQSLNGHLEQVVIDLIDEVQEMRDAFNKIQKVLDEI